MVAFRARYHLVEKEHDSGEGSHVSGGKFVGILNFDAKSFAHIFSFSNIGSEDRAPAAMARAVTVHANSREVMYFA